MSAHRCSSARRAIERAFVDSDAGRLSALRGDSDCANCRALLDTLLSAEAALCKRAGLGPLQRSLMLASALPAGALAETGQHAAPSRRFGWGALAGVVAATAVLLALAFSGGARLHLAATAGDDRFASRGGGLGPDEQLPRAGVRLLCMRAGADAKLSVRSLSSARHRCPRSGRLGFSAFNHSPLQLRLAIFVAGPRGHVVEVYAGSPGETLAPDRDETPLDIAVRLDAFGAGRLRVVALLSHGPASERARQAVSDGLRSGLAVDQITSPTPQTRLYGAALTTTE